MKEEAGSLYQWGSFMSLICQPSRIWAREGILMADSKLWEWKGILLMPHIQKGSDLICIHSWMTWTKWEIHNLCKGIRLHPHANLCVWKGQPDSLVQQPLQLSVLDDAVVACDFRKYHTEVQPRLKLEIFCSTLHGYGSSNIFNLEITDNLEITEIFVGALIETEWHGVRLLGPSIPSVDLMDMCVSFVWMPVIASTTRFFTAVTPPHPLPSSSTTLGTCTSTPVLIWDQALVSC